MNLTALNTYLALSDYLALLATILITQRKRKIINYLLEVVRTTITIIGTGSFVTYFYIGLPHHYSLLFKLSYDFVGLFSYSFLNCSVASF